MSTPAACRSLRPPVAIPFHLPLKLIPSKQGLSITVLLCTVLVLSFGCRSRISQAPGALPATSTCSNLTLSPEDLFQGAKPGIAVIRTASMEGSAFVVRHTNTSTLLVTNSHVVDGSSRVNLKWSDGRQDSGVVISNAGGQTPQADLALIEIQGVVGRALLLKNSPPSVGADVVAIGSPQGLDFSLTRGVLSSLRDNGQILQIDAPINPGNSGGPILDKSGCVVGVATFKLDNSEGLNFAIASSVVDAFLQGSNGSQENSGQAISPSSPPQSSPFSSVPTPAPGRAYPGSAQGDNCWFQNAPGSQQLSGSRCQISALGASQGRVGIELVDPSGAKRVIYLRTDQSAEVYMGGQRFDGKWVEDQDGDLRIHIEPEVFAFKSPG